MKSECIVALAAALIVPATAQGTEPNNSFDAATILSPGLLTVADWLGPGIPSPPDTFLGVRNQLGQIYQTDDNGSLFGDGRASGLPLVDTNSGEIDFSITGHTDRAFDGSHEESGAYEVFVDVFDIFGDIVDTFSEMRTLTPGVVHHFSYSDVAWIGGNYDVNVDNDLPPPADVDFFTFSGLTPGAQFTARTADPSANNIDTFLGWFGDEGGLLDTDDDGAGGSLSLIGGLVPSSGLLTFAVTGFGDDLFDGSHSENGSFELRLQLQSGGLLGDYNRNNRVDAADYVVWRNTLNTSGIGLPADGDRNGTVDSEDYNFWRARFGQVTSSGSGHSASTIVPEPATYLMLGLAVACWCVLGRTTFRHSCGCVLALLFNRSGIVIIRLLPGMHAGNL